MARYRSRYTPEKLAGIISLGCAKNLVDSEYLMGVLKRAGWTMTPRLGAAALIVVNTCGFINDAVAESRRAIAEALAEKRRRPRPLVVVAGCLVNRMGRRLAAEFPDADLFLRPGRIPRLARYLESSAPEACDFTGRKGFFPGAEMERLVSTGPWAYLKIADGCDNRCGYCLIPAIRGRHRSRRLADLVAETYGLAQAGVKEINLVAQDITRWRDERRRLDLADLLAALSAVPGEFRLRLLYLHPARVTQDVIAAVAAADKIFPYLDVPIQHSNDRILRNMKRGYTRRGLESLYMKLRRGIPGVALRTTIMVGYPGEGMREFRELISFLKDHPFENLGAFIFQPQPGTAAAGLPGAVSTREASERRRELMAIQKKLSERLWTSRIGTEVEALVTAPAGGRHWLGRTAWQAPEVDGVIRSRGNARPGSLVLVKVRRAGQYDLEGVEIAG